MKEILMGRFRKEEVVELLNGKPKCFDQTLELALQNLELVSWRAAWVLFHCMEEKDPRLQLYLSQLINAIPGKGDGHQRELLRIIGQLDVPEGQEGVLFDLCMNIWEQVGKIPSVRIFAFRIILKIARKYPDLQSELEFITQEYYLETLSPGIKRSIQRMAGQKHD